MIGRSIFALFFLLFVAGCETPKTIFLPAPPPVTYPLCPAAVPEITAETWLALRISAQTFEDVPGFLPWLGRVLKILRECEKLETERGAAQASMKG